MGRSYSAASRCLRSRAGASCRRCSICAGAGRPLGQAIGRIANFINQELYGPPTTLPWGLRIDAEHRIPPYNDLAAYPESVRFQPLFLYESLWNFVGFGLLFWISRRFEDRLRPGDLLLLYLIWYPAGRFMIEFVRTDSWFFPARHSTWCMCFRPSPWRFRWPCLSTATAPRRSACDVRPAGRKIPLDSQYILVYTSTCAASGRADNMSTNADYGCAGGCRIGAPSSAALILS